MGAISGIKIGKSSKWKSSSGWMWPIADVISIDQDVANTDKKALLNFQFLQKQDLLNCVSKYHQNKYNLYHNSLLPTPNFVSVSLQFLSLKFTSSPIYQILSNPSPPKFSYLWEVIQGVDVYLSQTYFHKRSLKE